MSGATEDTDRWCRWCGASVELAGSDADPEELRMAVHAATGEERGRPDGHLAAPVDEEPPLWAAVRSLREELGGTFVFSARFGVIRADWADMVTPLHYTARSEQEMRAKLRAPCIDAGLRPPALARVSGTAG